MMGSLTTLQEYAEELKKIRLSNLPHDYIPEGRRACNICGKSYYCIKNISHCADCASSYASELREMHREKIEKKRTKKEQQNKRNAKKKAQRLEEQRLEEQRFMIREESKRVSEQLVNDKKIRQDEEQQEPLVIEPIMKKNNPNTVSVTLREISKPGYVYLMKSGMLYKIGITNNLERRLKGVSAQSALPVTIVHSFLSVQNRKVEKRLHKKYADNHSHYEWFDLSLDQVDEIKSIRDYGLDKI